jgi:DNA-binding response OmpR family regulator
LLKWESVPKGIQASPVKEIYREAFIVGNLLVLVVEDDRAINSTLCEYLEKNGFRTLSAFEGKEALEIFNNAHPDLVILDLMLPEIDGVEVCRRIRKSSDTPILMLTALSDETDKLVGLEIGADDYITKPFSPREVVARIKAIMRRVRASEKPAAEATQITTGDLVIDREGCTVKLKGNPVILTATEYRIIEVLARHPGKVLSRSQLAELAYGNAFEGYDRTIDAHIKNIRQKFSPFAPDHDYILTSRGLGYKFDGPLR